MVARQARAVTRDMFRSYRRHAIVVLLVLAALITPHRRPIHTYGSVSAAISSLGNRSHGSTVAMTNHR